jgi:YesN/AraC family two-component response regulator
MMQSGEKNLKNIAVSCGFYNHRYFFDVFKKYTGCSATEYIKNIESGEKKE